MMADIETVRDELEKIRSADKQKRLRPESIVDYARKYKGSALHSKFLWDDSEAAELYRLKQAREIIKVAVTVITPENVPTVVTVSEYVSLSDSRGEGYELTVDVLDDNARAQILLQDTIKRLLSIKEVALFEELLAVHKAIQKAAAIYMPKPKEEKSRSRSESLRV